MKLNRDTFLKQEYEGGTLYQYVCNETNFFMYVKGKGASREISVFKGNVDDRQEEFKTGDSLEAWNKFEEYLTVCEPQQGSSGGFARNPQQDPQVLPLFAIKRNEATGNFNVKLFGLMDNGEQVTALEFEVDSLAIPYPYTKKVFQVDWKDEEIPTVFKAEIIMKMFPDVEFKEDKDASVFLFIPKSIVTQGGEEGGNTQGGDEPPQGGDEPPQGGGEPPESGDEPPQGGDEPPQGGGTPSDEPPSDEEPEDEEPPQQGGGEGTDEPIGDDTPRRDEEPIDFGQTIMRLAEITDTPDPSSILNVFSRDVENGETWLLVNNFDKIKRELNLPRTMTARQLSQQIINSK